MNQGVELLTQIRTLLLKSTYFRQQLISLVSRRYLRIGMMSEEILGRMEEGDGEVWCGVVL